MVVPDTSEPINLPTDLLGITVSRFDPHRSDGNLEAALGPVCFDLRVAMGLVDISDEVSTKRIRLDEERSRDLLLATHFLLVYDPSNGRSKRITFAEDGTVDAGSNANEAFWRIRDGYLELLQADHGVHSRFAYQDVGGTFVNTNDDDTVSKRYQVIHALPADT